MDQAPRLFAITTRINHLYQGLHERDLRLVLHYSNLTHSTILIRIIQQVQPNEA